MLEHDPADRPAAAEVAERLEPLIAGLPEKMSMSSKKAVL